ncbi:hypothetical protein B0H17DRAFT_103074 [Mycena rosella]|uniref:F-box domain-containing protein n=1 Tax=Mycena rosella TaxID=1033263 RepID=A0AAD7D4Q5_MYCRO|nr:hypothetical protein B0H17DRAFT_103074 [Mycena rosella]
MPDIARKPASGDDLSTKLWTMGLEFSRLFLGGERWNLPFIRVQDPSPISCLPADVLGEIFMWSLCTNGFHSLTERGCLMLEPLTLSHVNSRWRDVAISTSRLWSTIWVDRPREANVPMVELWLERSRQCPLIIYLRQTAPLPPGSQLPSVSDPREYELTDEIFLLLGQHLHRWKRVTFLLYKQTHRPLLSLPAASTAAPLLEHVYMNVKTWDADSSLAMERTMYSYHSVKSIVVHDFMSQDFVRWEHLTTLDAGQLGCPLASHLSVLKHCPSLRRAEIRCTQDHRDAPFVAPLRRVRIPQLASLTVYADRVDLAPLMDGLIFPNLEGLVFRYRQAPRRSNDPQALWRLLARSGCVLKRFSLKDIPLTPDDDHHLSFLRLPQMASLTELYMQLDLTDKIVRFLTLGSADGLPRTLPHLQTISLKDYRGAHIDDLELYRLVVSRFAAPGPDRNGRYSGALTRAYFHLRVKGHSASPVLPLLVERCRERLELRIYLDECDDLNTQVGWYTSPPIPGGYLTEG